MYAGTGSSDLSRDLEERRWYALLLLLGPADPRRGDQPSWMPRKLFGLGRRLVTGHAGLPPTMDTVRVEAGTAARTASRGNPIWTAIPDSAGTALTLASRAGSSPGRDR